MLRSGSLIRGEPLPGLLSHVPFALVGEQARRLVEGKPARFGDLRPHPLGVLPDPPAAGAQEKEADALKAPPPPLAPPGRGVAVADAPDLGAGAALDPGPLGPPPKS